MGRYAVQVEPRASLCAHRWRRACRAGDTMTMRGARNESPGIPETQKAISTFDKVWQTLEVAADVSAIALLRSGRGRLNVFETLAVITKLGTAAVTVDRIWRTRDEAADRAACDAWLAKQTSQDNPFEPLNYLQSSAILGGRTIEQTEKESEVAFEVGNARVYRVNALGIDTYLWSHGADGYGYGTMYVRTSDLPKLLSASRNKLWLGGTMVEISTSVTAAKPRVGTTPPWMLDLEKRIKAFAGKPRTYLVNAEPGTGKSRAVEMLAQTLGRVAILDAENVVSDYRISVPMGTWEHQFSLSDTLRFLEPDVVVVNDLDRVRDTAAVLALLDLLRRITKVVIVTSNYAENFDAAEARIGRIDDVISIPALTLDQVNLVLGDQVGVFSEDQRQLMTEWPYAYVEDIAERTRRLGVQVAAQEFETVSARRKGAYEDWRRGPRETNEEPKPRRAQRDW